MTAGRDAVTAAAITLDRVVRHGAFSNVLVRSTAVDPVDAHGRYQRIVYTALRHLPAIDARIAKASSRPLRRIDPLVLSVLRVGVTDGLYLATPDHAVVDRTVETARTLAGERTSGFTNAVLRSVLRDRTPPDDTVEGAYPSSFSSLVESALGPAESHRFLTASNRPAAIGIRDRRDPASSARYVDDIDGLDADPEGMVDVIDPASAAVVRAMGVGVGWTVLDLAAAPGGKTRAIADLVGPRGKVIASDRHIRRLRDAARRSSALRHVVWIGADAAKPPFTPGCFDGILLDAPCTGVGTMRRRPEIRFRVEPGAPARYGVLQRTLLQSAMSLAASGTRVVYSVCTVFPEETVDVVDGLGFRAPDDVVGEPWGDGTLLAPHTTGTDGMFIAVRDG